MIYKIIPGHRNYQVSECGKSFQLVSDKNGRVKELKQSFHPVKGKEYPNGYLYVTPQTQDYQLPSGEVVDIPYRQSKGLARMVALAWIANPNNLPEVDHKDTNKLNNSVSNLQWVTHAHNVQLSYDRGRKTYKGIEHWKTGKKASKQTKIKQSLTKLGELHPKYKGYYIIIGRKYHSLLEAERITKIDRRTIKKRCLDSDELDYTFVPVLKPI